MLVRRSLRVFWCFSESSHVRGEETIIFYQKLIVNNQDLFNLFFVMFITIINISKIGNKIKIQLNLISSPVLRILGKTIIQYLRDCTSIVDLAFFDKEYDKFRLKILKPKYD